MSILISNTVNVENNNPHKDIIWCPKLLLSVKTNKVKTTVLSLQGNTKPGHSLGNFTSERSLCLLKGHT